MLASSMPSPKLLLIEVLRLGLLSLRSAHRQYSSHRFLSGRMTVRTARTTRKTTMTDETGNGSEGLRMLVAPGRRCFFSTTWRSGLGASSDRVHSLAVLLLSPAGLGRCLTASHLWCLLVSRRTVSAFPIPSLPASAPGCPFLNPSRNLSLPFPSRLAPKAGIPDSLFPRLSVLGADHGHPPVSQLSSEAPRQPVLVATLRRTSLSIFSRYVMDETGGPADVLDTGSFEPAPVDDATYMSCRMRGVSIRP